MLKLKKSYSAARWVAMGTADDDPAFLIRPFPASKGEMRMTQDGELVISSARQWEMFNHCVTNWKYIVDDDDKPVPCTEHNKRLLFDLALGGVPAFVFGEIRKMQLEREQAEKNLQPGHDGDGAAEQSQPVKTAPNPADAQDTSPLDTTVTGGGSRS